MRECNAATLAAIREKRYWRERDARRVLEALSASDLSLAAFCRQHGLKDERVRRWRSELGERSAKPVEMLPVRLVERTAPAATQGEMQVVLRNGRRIAVTGPVDGALLTELAAEVEAWGC